MKRFLAMIGALLILLTIPTAWASDDRPIDFEQLPQEAQQFVKLHFADWTVAYVTLEKGLLSREYKVLFNEGGVIEFNEAGLWKEVETKQEAVPQTLIPSVVRDYLHINHPKQSVQKIERDKKHYEVELSNGLELKFSHDFRLLSVD